MSILISGMEMPEDREIMIRIDSSGTVMTEYGLPISGAKAIPVPSHGRLIDANVLYEDCALDHDYQVIATTTRINEYMQLKIDNASTIIEAEEVYDKYTDTAGNFHWCGTKSGEHTIKA